MTIKAFQDYLFSFNKEPGQYTREEIEEIVLTYKNEVSVTDKLSFTWEDLATFIHSGQSGEALRSLARRLLNKCFTQSDEDDVFPKKKYAPIMNVAGEMSKEEVDAVTNEQLRELYKKKQQERDIVNNYRRTLRDESRIETFKEFLQECISKLPALPEFVYDVKTQTSDKEAVLMFSDLHIGVDCDNFYNTYNLDVARERVSKLVSDTIDYCKTNKVKRLNVVNLGDLIHGLIHINARLEQQFDVATQVSYAAEIMAEALNKLQQAAPEVIYRSVVDNHSRMVADKSQHIEKESFCKIIDELVEYRLKLSKSKVKISKDNLDNGLGYFELLNGKKIIFAHGHEDSINRSFQAFIGAKRDFIDYALLGHFHSAKMKSFNDFTVFVNGSIVGTEEYALSKRLFTKPQQVLLIFDKDNVINTTINLA